MANSESKKLTVDVIARIDKLEKGMARASQVANRSMGSIESRAKRMETTLAGVGTRASAALSRAFAGIAAGVGLNEIRKAADTYTKILNSLRVAGVGESDLPKTLDAVYQSAIKNAVPMQALAELYGRVSQAQTTLGASSKDLLGFTDIVAQSLRVAGTSATEASGGLLQLGQALASGKVQAEEYASIQDSMFPLLQAVAAGMREAGGDVAKLTTLVKAGEVSSRAFYDAARAGAGILKDKLANSVLTTDQAMQNLRTEFEKAAGEFDKATGLSKGLAVGLDSVASSMSGIGTAAASAVNGVQALVAKVGELYAANGAVLRQQGLTQGQERAAMRQQGRDMGTANAGGRDAVAAERAAADRAAGDAARVSFRAAENAFADQQAAAAAKAAAAVKPPVVPGPVSVKDPKYAVPGKESAGGGGGGGGSSSKEKLDAYERELIQMEKRTKALQLEAEMTGKSTFEREKARAALELETAAKKANVPITNEMRTAIEASATGYANAKVRVEEMTKALEGAQEAQRFFGDAITDSLSDLIVDGGKADEVLRSLIKQLAKAAIQAALLGSGPLAGIFGTSGTNGNVGGVFGMLPKLFGFADGGYTGAGGRTEPKGVVHGGEFVFSKKAVQKLGVGNLDALHRGFSSGGLVGPSVPAGLAGGGGGKPAVNVNVTNNAGVAVETKQESNGDITMIISAVQAKIADDMLRGRGPMSAANRALGTNRHLRG